jgi:hypothetical protein
VRSSRGVVSVTMRPPGLGVVGQLDQFEHLADPHRSRIQLGE